MYGERRCFFSAITWRHWWRRLVTNITWPSRFLGSLRPLFRTFFSDIYLHTACVSGSLSRAILLRRQGWPDGRLHCTELHSYLGLFVCALIPCAVRRAAANNYRASANIGIHPRNSSALPVLQEYSREHSREQGKEGRTVSRSWSMYRRRSGGASTN